MSESITERNRSYYNAVYSSRFTVFGLIHSLVSYDQQSKSRRNYEVLKPIFYDKKKTTVGIKFLDYGFGHGTLLLKYIFDYKIFIYGCDLASCAVAKFEKIGSLFGRKNFRVFTSDRCREEVGLATIDVICCSHVIEHVDEDKELLQLFYSLLKNDGVCLLNLPINEVYKDPRHVRSYTIQSIVRLLEEIGFYVKLVVEADRLSGLLVGLEQNHCWGWSRPFLRIFRLVLGLLPLRLLNFLECFLPDYYKAQQLIIIASKMNCNLKN